MIILFSSLLIIAFLGYNMYYFSEESKILTLRARLLVLGIMTALIIGLSFSGIDDNFHRQYLQKWLPIGEPLSQTLYYIGAGLLGALAILLYIQNSTFTSQLIVISLSIVFARFVHYYLPEHVFAAALYVIGAYYLFVLLSNLFQKTLERITALLAGAILLLLIVMLADSFRFHHYWATYVSLLFTGGIWIRFFWLLEYKRRQKCPECSGWGKKTAKFKDFFWWAVGYKERTQSNDYELEFKQNMMHLLGYKGYQATPTQCEKCKGKGWLYREHYGENILHTPTFDINELRLKAPPQTNKPQ